jgi:cytochrome c oxidase assembly factor CtaG
LFRFENLARLQEATNYAWFAYLFAWVVINEAMSHENVSTPRVLGWFQLAYCHLMMCKIAYRDLPTAGKIDRPWAKVCPSAMPAQGI